MQAVAEQMIRWRWPLLLIGLGLGVGLYSYSRQVSYDQSIESMFAESDPRLVTYRRLVSDFKTDAACLAVYRDPKLMTADGLARLDAFTRNLRQIDGVLSASSLAEQKILKPGLSLFGRMMIDVKDAFTLNGADEAQLKKSLLEHPIYRDVLVSKDGQTAAILLSIDQQCVTDGRFEETLRQMRAKGQAFVSSHQLPGSVYYVGNPVIMSDIYRAVNQDSARLTQVSLGAMLVVILILFRHWRWAVLPGAIVQLSLILTQSLMVYCEIQLSLVTSMTTSLVTVIAIATSIHIAVKFREEAASGGDHAREALVRTLAKVGPAVFWTCGTTALGFGALYVSGVAPVRDYAILMGSASIFVGVSAFLLVPGGVLVGGGNPVPRATPGEDSLARGLDSGQDFVRRYPRLALAATLLIVVGTGWGFRWLGVETDFTKNFRDDSSIVQGYQFVESNMGGAGVVDVAFTLSEDPSSEEIDKVRQLEEQLRQLPGVTKVTGLTDIIDAGANSFGLPVSLLSFKTSVAAIKKFDPNVVQAFYNQSNHRMHLVLRVNEKLELKEKSKLIAEIGRLSNQALDKPENGPVDVTGLYVMLSSLVSRLLADQWLAFGVSAVGIFLMIGLAFWNWRFGLLGLLLNVIPLVVVMGMMGWLGFLLNTVTVMIGSISMGLVVDFTIHYLHRFQQEKREGKTSAEAVEACHQSTGKAMVFANLALMIGFGVLVFSNFVPTIHFGVLVSIAILGGLMGNLILLPIFLQSGNRTGSSILSATKRSPSFRSSAS